MEAKLKDRPITTYVHLNDYIGWIVLQTRIKEMPQGAMTYTIAIYKGTKQQCTDWLRTMRHQKRLV